MCFRYHWLSLSNMILFTGLAPTLLSVVADNNDKQRPTNPTKEWHLSKMISLLVLCHQQSLRRVKANVIVLLGGQVLEHV